MSVRIYVEGGGQGSTKSKCRQAFRMFFQKVVPPTSFTVIASGDRAAAFQDFCLAIEAHQHDFIILLVDSEEAVTVGAWQHLGAREGDKWRRPAGTHEDQAHLMVQVMEAWFLADQQALIAYYGQGFLAGSLPAQGNIELIPKQEVFRCLQHASRKTTKGEYRKATHGFDLLERIRPDRVRAASNHANRLLDTLAKKAAG